MKEELRLLYVATTRAQYSLHLTFIANKDDRQEQFRSASNFLDFIPRSIPVTEHTLDEFDFINLQSPLERF